MLQERKCSYCGKKFIPTVKTNIYCSIDCQYENRKKRQREGKGGEQNKIQKRPCIICGMVYQPKRANGTCCSDKCRRKHYQKMQTISNKKLKEKKKVEKMLEKIKIQEARKNSSLAEMNERARELGMSYGKYILYLEFQNKHSISTITHS